MKPNLYCFGDSYIYWHWPKLHWTLRFENEYKVHRLGKPGSSNQQIIWQTRYLPKYQLGDRVLFVFAEISRLPKWIWGEHYKDLAFDKKVYSPYIDTLLQVRDRLISQVEHRVEHPLHEKDKTSAYDFYLWIPMLNILLKEYRPVYLTWSKSTYNTLSPFIDIAYIDGTEYSTVTDETGQKIRNTHYDSHPGEKGGLVWYNTAKKLLDQ